MPNANKICELVKFDSYEYKSVMREAQGQMCPRCMSQEIWPTPRYIHHVRGMRLNTLEACELGNSTCAKIYLSWWRHKIKYAWDALVKKTKPAWRKIYYDRGARLNAPEACESINLIRTKKYSPWWRCEVKCSWDAWVKKTRSAWREICYDGGTRLNVLKVCESGNLTYAKIYPPRWRHEAKCTWDAWVKKTQPICRILSYGRVARLNMPEICESEIPSSRKEKSGMTKMQGQYAWDMWVRNSTHAKIYLPQWRHEAKCARDAWVQKT